MSISGTMRALTDQRGAIRVEGVYDTDIEDLWQACTTPDRLARWIARVSGDLRVGGTAEVTFTSTATGPMRIEVCDRPHRLLLTMEPGSEDQSEIEAWLQSEGERTRLVVEERGLPADKLHFYGAGWQAHLEDLGRSLTRGDAPYPGDWSARTPAARWHERWTQLVPSYEGRSGSQSGASR